MGPVQHEGHPAITQHVHGIHPGGHVNGPAQSSGSHHEATWLGIGPVVWLGNQKSFAVQGGGDFRAPGWWGRGVQKMGSRV